MKKVLSLLSILVFAQSLYAENLQSTIDEQAMQIKQLKRDLSLKEQELKILLITIKNSKQESMLHSNGQHLEFSDVNDVSPTRVVVNPSMLSETSIKAIDKVESVDMSKIPLTENNETDVVVSQETQAPQMETDSIPTEQVVSAKKMPEKMDALSYMKPSTFTLIVNTKVFNTVHDRIGVAWAEGKRFTSNKKRGDWIQITGEINQGKWKQVYTELWIDSACVKKVR